MKNIQYISKHIGRFISTIITFVISLVLSYIGLNLLLSTPLNGIGALSLIAIIPVCLILGVGLVSTLISTIINSCICINSSSVIIKVLSILILILTLIIIGFVVYKIINLF